MVPEGSNRDGVFVVREVVSRSILFVRSVVAIFAPTFKETFRVRPVETEDDRYLSGTR